MRVARPGCIPTCVGQTWRPANTDVTFQVYPHLRGADFKHKYRAMDMPGVSPPAWGRPSLRYRDHTIAWCIPTCVGQTGSIQTESIQTPVYPHLRGADRGGEELSISELGVSPPAWGRLQVNTILHRYPGCIPTCVGQTSTTGFPVSNSGVYPHLRGADRF